ncbi:uncharacterized protein B0H18DRAFT_1123897 [Fomitopsis serialis]|uniref:uncharacterized protein n=1 Tax=Fomitopsis serialis TaxID=139415 RepID=UPI002008B90E|nr:uncharacterized protein B0H18DRAFT_1123897 [Neoantrodia serialis]KAH9916910.1 hypothetical protein B0H18DRAFT_1123897 [Neoantrodia serialis]
MTRLASPKMARMQQLSNEHDQERNFRELDRILARSFVRELLRHRARQPSGPPTDRLLRPRMDLCDEPASAYIVATLELPGLKQEDLSVRIENGLLVVQGERRFRSLARTPSRSLAASPSPDPAHAGQGPVASTSALARAQSAEPASRAGWPDAQQGLPYAYTTQEIKYGTFQRTLALPLGTQVGHVRASLTEGMLTLSWPRNPHAVPVHAAGQDDAASARAREQPGSVGRSG